MFQISRESDYAVRVLVLFSQQEPGRCLRTEEIAAKQLIPLPFLRKILKRLVQCGYLDSRRGPGGGFQLRVDPRATSLLEVVRSFEGDFGLNVCVICGGGCPLQPRCAVHDVWREAWERVEKLLKGAHLQALAEASRRKGLQGSIEPRKE